MSAMTALPTKTEPVDALWGQIKSVDTYRLTQDTAKKKAGDVYLKITGADTDRPLGVVHPRAKQPVELSLSAWQAAQAC